MNNSVDSNLVIENLLETVKALTRTNAISDAMITTLRQINEEQQNTIYALEAQLTDKGEA